VPSAVTAAAVTESVTAASSAPRHLQLSLPLSSVLVVNNAASLAQAEQCLLAVVHAGKQYVLATASGGTTPGSSDASTADSSAATGTATVNSACASTTADHSVGNSSASSSSEYDNALLPPCIGLDVEWRADFHKKTFRKNKRPNNSSSSSGSNASSASAKRNGAGNSKHTSTAAEAGSANGGESDDSHASKAALLQVATPTAAFLFDTFALCTSHSSSSSSRSSSRSNISSSSTSSNSSNCNSTAAAAEHDLERRFDALISALFSEPGVLCLGFGFGHDQRELRKSWPNINGFQLPVTSLLDIGLVCKAMHKGQQLAEQLLHAASSSSGKCV
jgi:hypothetical protein